MKAGAEVWQPQRAQNSEGRFADGCFIHDCMSLPQGARMSIPYFPMYPTDFEADTAHLTLEEDGAYNRLLRLMWMTPGCSVPDDPAWIARRMRVDMVTYLRLVEPLINEFCKRIGGRVVSPRLQREWKKADVTSRLRSEAGKRGGRPKAIENKEEDAKPGISQAKAGPKQPEPEPYPDIEKREAKASPKSDADEIRKAIEAWASPDATASFIAYRRKAKGKALTLTAARRLATHLRTIFDRGGDTDDALGMAEERGWQTVEADWYFNAKGNGNGNGHRGGNAKPGPHNALMAGFALAAHSKPQ